MAKASAYRWEFRPRFRRHAFGWRSQPAIKRIKEAVSEIKKVARKDKILAAEGAVLLLEKVSPAIEHVDSSSGAIGTAVNNAIAALVAIIAAAPAAVKTRDAWLERLWVAYQDDEIPYIESLGDYWGELCVTKETASRWADQLMGTCKMVWSRDPDLHGFFKGTTNCLSALLAAERCDELLELLEMSPYKTWHYRKYGVKALAALGKKAEAIRYAEEGRGLNDSPIAIARACEEVLLSSGLADEAYTRYGLLANQAGTYATWFRTVAKKYPHKKPAEILEDLVAETPGEEGKWFAAAKDAKLGCADPSDVDAHLRQGANAFLGKNYGAAFQVFRALLLPIGNVDIDLGQHEMLDEVLGVDVAACAAQYVVSMYMTAIPKNRAKAVLSAIDEIRGIGHFWEPLRELERVAVEPLPEFDDFLTQWRSLVEERVAKDRNTDGDSNEDRWLREVVQRTHGPEGLAELARASKRADDLRAWCRALVEADDWETALTAYDEAAELVTDPAYARGDFLDGGALAALELGRKDLPDRLKRAWREAPSMVRLRRWLGSSKTKKVLSEHVTEALTFCPTISVRQRALLHVLDGDFAAAAKLLAGAAGLGWSSVDHPGHLLFPLFVGLLGGIEWPEEPERDFDRLSPLSDRDEAQLATPELRGLLDLAGVAAIADVKVRGAVVSAMRRAAEKRIAGVTENKRRRHYGHAASLALACTQVDSSAETGSWLAAIRDEYRRYPALQRELGQRRGT